MTSESQAKRLWNHQISEAIDTGDVDLLLHVVRYQKPCSQTHLFGAILELGKAGDERALEAVRPYLTSSRPRLRTAAAMYFSHVRDPTVCPELQTLTADGDGGVRSAAFEAIAAINCPGAVGALRKGLSDPKLWARITAATGLATIGDTSSIEAIRGALRRELWIIGGRKEMERALAELERMQP